MTDDRLATRNSNPPNVLVSPDVVSLLRDDLALRAKVLENDAAGLALEEKANERDAQVAEKAIQARVDGARIAADESKHRDQMRTIVAVVIALGLVAVVIVLAVWGRESALREVLQALIYVTTAGGGGFALGRATAKPAKPD